MATRHPVLVPAVVTALAVVVAHLVYLRGPLLADEGGFTMVARWWGSPGGDLYGAQWVDRPPGLIAVFWLADQFGSSGPRLMAGLVAALFVLAAAWAGSLVRGTSGARWAMAAAFFVMVTPLTQTFALNGELVAATWTMVAVAAALAVVASPRWSARSAGLALVAGVSAGAAVMTKQNFLDAAAFVAVLGLAHLVVNRSARAVLAGLAVVCVVGFAIPIAVVVWWAASHGGISELVYALYGFRVDAAVVLENAPSPAVERRRVDLVGVAVGTGMAPVAIGVAVAGLGRLRALPSPLLCAGVASGLIALVGVVFGGNYWTHYLIGLAPMLVLATASLAPETGRGARLLRTQVVLAVVVAVVMTPLAGAIATRPNAVSLVGASVGAAAQPADTVVSLYSHAAVIEASGLRPTYPYAWSLPIRTLDPDLETLHATLSDPLTAPTWVIGWDPLNEWKLDGDHRIESLLAAEYRRAATVCTHPIWVRRGAERPEPADPCRAGQRYHPGKHVFTLP